LGTTYSSDTDKYKCLFNFLSILLVRFSKLHGQHIKTSAVWEHHCLNNNMQIGRFHSHTGRTKVMLSWTNNFSKKCPTPYSWEGGGGKPRTGKKKSLCIAVEKVGKVDKVGKVVREGRKGR
jgi:hypothetical protein